MMCCPTGFQWPIHESFISFRLRINPLYAFFIHFQGTAARDAPRRFKMTSTGHWSSPKHTSSGGLQYEPPHVASVFVRRISQPKTEKKKNTPQKIWLGSCARVMLYLLPLPRGVINGAETDERVLRQLSQGGRAASTPHACCALSPL